MKKTLLVGCMALGLAFAAFAPAVIHADEVSFGVNIGADDQAHYDFRGHHHDPMIIKAAQRLQEAKHIIWNSGHHGVAAKRAIQAINNALDQLNWIEHHGHNNY